MTRTNKIKIRANGKYLYIGKNLSVKDLLEKLKLPTKKVAIEHNKKILDKNKLKKVILKNKDTIEIVHFIGGG